NVWIPSYFLNKIVALLEHVAADSHELVSVRRVRQIVHRKNQDLRKMTGFLLVLVRILRNLFDNLPVALWRRNFAFDRGGVELTLVFDVVEDLAAFFRVYFSNLFGFF